MSDIKERLRCICDGTDCCDSHCIYCAARDQLVKYEDLMDEAVYERRDLKADLKAARAQWLRAKCVLGEFLAWYETGARMDSLQLERIRDMASDLENAQ